MTAQLLSGKVDTCWPSCDLSAAWGEQGSGFCLVQFWLSYSAERVTAPSLCGLGGAQGRVPPRPVVAWLLCGEDRTIARLRCTWGSAQGGMLAQPGYSARWAEHAVPC